MSGLEKWAAEAVKKIVIACILVGLPWLVTKFFFSDDKSEEESGVYETHPSRQAQKFTVGDFRALGWGGQITYLTSRGCDVYLEQIKRCILSHSSYTELTDEMVEECRKQYDY
ncbi:MAG: hypothetical protein KDD41_08690 [Flavobacteriales bacterium]|nr:hypothetical protein [Flavobacteriales bacterium]